MLNDVCTAVCVAEIRADGMDVAALAFKQCSLPPKLPGLTVYRLIASPSSVLELLLQRPNFITSMKPLS